MSATPRREAAGAPAGTHDAVGQPGDAAVPHPGDPGPDDPVARALAFLLRSTANRPQSEAEVAAKLRGRGYDDAVVDATLAQARAVGAVDDAAFAAAWVDDRARRGYAPARLRAELRRRQVPDDVADAAVGALDDRDELAVATDLARRRAQQLPATLTPEAVARRLVGFLARRGYADGLARAAALTASGLDREWD